MLDVGEALMAEQMGLSGIPLFIEAINAPETPEGDEDPAWDEWGTDPDAQARMEAAMAMMGGAE